MTVWPTDTIPRLVVKDYVSTYNRVETNQPPQDLFISSMSYLVWLLFFSSYNMWVPNDSWCIISFPCECNASLKQSPKEAPGGPTAHSTSIPDRDQLWATQLRLSSHRLVIETGRWSRIPRDNRLCSCGAIQTEEHVICFCLLSHSIRSQFDTVYCGIYEHS